MPVLRFNLLKQRQTAGQAAAHAKFSLEATAMRIANDYLNGLMERVIARNPAEPEFHQAVGEVLTSLA